MKSQTERAIFQRLLNEMRLAMKVKQSNTSYGAIKAEDSATEEQSVHRLPTS